MAGAAGPAAHEGSDKVKRKIQNIVCTYGACLATNNKNLEPFC